MPIIRRNNRIYATLGICHSVWMTVWYAQNMQRKEINILEKLDTKLALFTSSQFVLYTKYQVIKERNMQDK